jgi:ParB/RepB/Spo0J family partition protein
MQTTNAIVPVGSLGAAPAASLTQELEGVSAGDQSKLRAPWLAQIKLNAVDLPPNQARTVKRNEEIAQQIAQSVKDDGIFQPIVVSGQPNGRFTLILGFGRFEAAQHAGRTEVPALVYEGGLSNVEVLRWQFVENQFREGLNVIDQARVFQQIQEERGFTQQQLAEFLGVRQPHISECLKLLKAPPEMRKKIEDGKLSAKGALRKLRSEEKGKRPPKAATATAQPEARNGVGVDRVESWHDRETGFVFSVIGKGDQLPSLDTLIPAVRRWLAVLAECQPPVATGLGLAK